MLVLTRKSQEKIHIGEHVTITVVRIQGNTVRVGIEAPQDVRVIRGEIAAAEASSVDAPKPHETAAPAPCNSEVASGEDIDHVIPGRGITGRASARPGRRMSTRPDITLLSTL